MDENLPINREFRKKAFEKWMADSFHYQLEFDENNLICKINAEATEAIHLRLQEYDESSWLSKAYRWRLGKRIVTERVVLFVSYQYNAAVLTRKPRDDSAARVATRFDEPLCYHAPHLKKLPVAKWINYGRKVMLEWFPRKPPDKIKVEVKPERWAWLRLIWISDKKNPANAPRSKQTKATTSKKSPITAQRNSYNKLEDFLISCEKAIEILNQWKKFELSTNKLQKIADGLNDDLSYNYNKYGRWFDNLDTEKLGVPESLKLTEDLARITAAYHQVQEKMKAIIEQPLPSMGNSVENSGQITIYDKDNQLDTESGEKEAPLSPLRADNLPTKEEKKLAIEKKWSNLMSLWEKSYTELESLSKKWQMTLREEKSPEAFEVKKEQLLETLKEEKKRLRLLFHPDKIPEEELQQAATACFQNLTPLFESIQKNLEDCSYQPQSEKNNKAKSSWQAFYSAKLRQRGVNTLEELQKSEIHHATESLAKKERSLAAQLAELVKKEEDELHKIEGGIKEKESPYLLARRRASQQYVTEVKKQGEIYLAELKRNAAEFLANFNDPSFIYVMEEKYSHKESENRKATSKFDKICRQLGLANFIEGIRLDHEAFDSQLGRIKASMDRTAKRFETSKKAIEERFETNKKAFDAFDERRKEDIKQCREEARSQSAESRSQFAELQEKFNQLLATQPPQLIEEALSQGKNPDQTYDSSPDKAKESQKLTSEENANSKEEKEITKEEGIPSNQQRVPVTPHFWKPVEPSTTGDLLSAPTLLISSEAGETNSQSLLNLGAGG
jgi:hypothetical protein